MYEVRDKTEALRYVIEDISRCLTFDGKLSHSLVSQFISCSADDSGSFFDVSKTDQYISMKNMLYEVWQYREWETMSPEQAFLYGQLYGSVKLFDDREESRQETLWIDSLASKYKDSDLFHLVKGEPGIRHKDLAQKMNISAGRLSQILHDEEMDDLFCCRTLGREKHYFLSPRGELLFQKLDGQRKEAETHHRDMADIPLSIDNNNIFNDNIWAYATSVETDEPWIMFSELESRFQMHSKHRYKHVMVRNKMSNNALRMEQSEEEEKKCLTRENFYCVQ